MNHKFDGSKTGGKVVEYKTVSDLMNRMKMHNQDNSSWPCSLWKVVDTACNSHLN